METIEVLKNVQRIALECMIGRKPVHNKCRRYAGDGRFMRHRTGQISRGSLHGDIQ